MSFNLLSLILMIGCIGCSTSSPTEKYQEVRDRIIQMGDKVKEIEIDEVLIGNSSVSYVVGDYLLIQDYRSWDKLMHLFNKKDFSYVTSIGETGQGPGEIANIGFIGVNEKDRVFYVNDHRKQKVFSYKLDSVLVNPSYMPEVKMELKETQFPCEYKYITDTLCVGRIIEPIGHNDFKAIAGRWNMQTGEIRLMPYEHPEVKKKRIMVDASAEHGIYVECHSRYDLMTICSLDGELKYNVYGRNWKHQEARRINYYGKVVICGDKILVTYLEDKAFTEDKAKGFASNLPTQILVFELNGDYLKTLDIGYRITGFCYDKDHHRIILDLNDDIQFAYLDLEGI